jgi:mannose-6-phosphate isomerase-like protein (cupin superfamily)
MTIRNVTPAGRVLDQAGRPIERLDLAEGAAISDLGRTELLSALLYTLADGVADPQPVHSQDEVYVVVSGRAVAVVAQEHVEVRRGSVLIVPAHTAHHFEDAADGFAAVAVFAPPLA